MPTLKHVATALFLALATCFLSQKTWAAEEKIAVQKIHFSKENNLEISLSQKGTFKIFTLTNPRRLVVDISNANLANPDEQVVLPKFISSFRSKKNGDSLRLVFDLTKKISIDKVRFEKVKDKSGKITAEIIDPATSAAAAPTVAPKAVAPKAASPKSDDFIASKVEEFEVKTTKVIKPDGTASYVVRKIPKITAAANILSHMPVIVIDAGHGGKDPGTIGNYARSKEKNITLSYAKELAKQLGNTKRYKVYLTRDTDIFIPLKKRVELARRKKADMFISLHANAISDDSVSGFSIYTLSEKSSDRQAELLAQKENRADIISGVNFSGASQDIMKTLIDLSQRETMNGSARFATIAIKSVRSSSINILQNTHRFAGFAVLTAPDMVSTLIELGYLSNRDEETLMNSLSYKRRVADSLVGAIDEYFAKNKT
jgi:N-acetylmuramoyl-L-alanine amidase